MAELQTFEHSSFKVQCFCIEGAPWFKGKDIATILGYKNTTQAILVNVDEDDRNKIEELTKHLPNRCLPGNSKTLSSLTNQVSIH